MKNFKYFILFLSLITIFEITNSEDANAVTACATNSDGEIVYATTPTSGCIAVGKATNYEITVKEIHLCRTAPIGPTTSTATDLSNCENILTNSAATASSFAAGEDVSIAGTFTRPSDGTYTHAYIRFDNVIGITAAMKFDTSINGGGSGTGKFCRTIVSSGTHQSGSSHDLSVCASSETTPGKLTETLKQFGNADGTYRGCVKDGTVAAASSGSCGTLGSTNGFLVDTDLKLATASSGVDEFHGILAFGTPQKVTPNTTSFVVRFDVTNGAVTAKTGGGTSAYIGLGPFDMSIAIQ